MCRDLGAAAIARHDRVPVAPHLCRRRPRPHCELHGDSGRERASLRSAAAPGYCPTPAVRSCAGDRDLHPRPASGLPASSMPRTSFHTAQPPSEWATCPSSPSLATGLPPPSIQTLSAIHGEAAAPCSTRCLQNLRNLAASLLIHQ